MSNMAAKKKYTNCDEVFKALQKYFSSKAFDIGDRVPAERKIADDLKVNRTTLRTAMQRMVKDGLIARQVGVGTFFKISPKAMAENYKKINTKCNHNELFEMRMLLEPQIACYASLNICPESVSVLRKIIKVKSNIEAQSLEEIDIEFHTKIAELSRNSMIAQVYSVIADLRKKMMKNIAQNNVSCGGFACVESWKNNQNDIIEAMENKDSEAVKKAVKSKLHSLEGMYSTLKK